MLPGITQTKTTPRKQKSCETGFFNVTHCSPAAGSRSLRCTSRPPPCQPQPKHSHTQRPPIWTRAIGIGAKTCPSSNSREWIIKHKSAHQAHDWSCYILCRFMINWENTAVWLAQALLSRLPLFSWKKCQPISTAPPRAPTAPLPHADARQSRADRRDIMQWTHHGDVVLGGIPEDYRE